MRFLMFASFILYSLYTQAQELSDNLVWVKLSVYDKVNNKPIDGAQVISYKTMLSYVTDSLGQFRNTFNESDSLKIYSLGYDGQTIKVKQFKQLENGIEIYLNRRTYMIRSVDVPAKKELHLHLPEDIQLAKKNDTPPPLRSDVFSSKPPIIAAVINPISYAYYFTSKKERRKRKAIQAIRRSKDHDIIRTFFNREIIKEVSGYEDGEKLNKFIIYCNLNIRVTVKDNPLIVKHKILKSKEKFEKKLEKQSEEQKIKE